LSEKTVETPTIENLPSMTKKLTLATPVGNGGPTSKTISHNHLLLQIY